MRSSLFSIACTAMILCGASPPFAQPVTAVRAIPGYMCMRLNVSREQMVSRELDVPIYAAPSAQAARIGNASAALIVKTPMDVQNGFVQLLFFNGEKGWIQRALLKPYVTPEIPNAHCTPAVLSNGRIGFDYK